MPFGMVSKVGQGWVYRVLDGVDDRQSERDSFGGEFEASCYNQ